jgi:plastocyanin
VTATDKSFDSEGLDTAGTWQHVFNNPGTYHYFCELHPYMKATIVVLPASK